jgi:hypothetical protein
MSPGSASSNDSSPTPTLEEFLAWPVEQVRELTRQTTALLSTSGTSRWYFVEHGSTELGYDEPELFEQYGRLVIDRVIEIADFVFADGVPILFIPAFAGGQGSRNREYLKNLRWVYRLLIDQVTSALYEKHRIGVIFRGNWQGLFSNLGGEDLSSAIRGVEAATAGYADQRLLIWYVQDDYIPSSLQDIVRESLAKGCLPNREKLAQAYYGRPLETVDILIGNNKPSLPGVWPPLLGVKDLYFTVSPITYLQQADWRRILYDHLFSRRKHFRDFKLMTPQVTREMKAFYANHQEKIIGLGHYHQPSQSWRPVPWSDVEDREGLKSSE